MAGWVTTRERWFDAKAFRRVDYNIGRPELCHYGNAGQGILVSPGAKVVDMSVYKTVAFRCSVNPSGCNSGLNFSMPSILRSSAGPA